MKAIVTVVEKILSEAHIDIPEGLAELGIRQHVVDHYNSGEMLPLLNIFHVDFESMSVHIGKKTPNHLATWKALEFKASLLLL